MRLHGLASVAKISNPNRSELEDLFDPPYLQGVHDKDENKKVIGPIEDIYREWSGFDDEWPACSSLQSTQDDTDSDASLHALPSDTSDSPGREFFCLCLPGDN